MSQQTTQRVVVVSGGFDPVHIGHVRMFKEAKHHGNRLIIILNNDNWLRAKKGYVFMPQEQRKEILESFEAVDEVVLTNHASEISDMSVCAELRALRPAVFANGGDRKSDNVPEYALCEELGIEMVFGVGHGDKVQSSSWLIAAAANNIPCPCGAVHPTTGHAYKYAECGLVQASYHRT